MDGSHKRNRGFTLIEILVVLAILAGVVVMLANGTGEGAQKAKLKQAEIDMALLETSIKQELLSGKYRDVDKIAADYNSTKSRKDPWGNPYLFTVAPNGTQQRTILTIEFRYTTKGKLTKGKFDTLPDVLKPRTIDLSKYII
ncbi:MAG: prepilin-type N-terminal cleavage/methylation domain-containing protein [Puniceicoccales bacterium]|jgi:prepilin-type N-terminal cleavage/methylation domain-containing protein|nr:prepilin-type N-terminal cleavage/methylation domain-containing protein [Puniceicoccales bacterium]